MCEYAVVILVLLFLGRFQEIPGRADEIVSGKQSGNIFYSFAEEIRAIALLQAAVPHQAGTLSGSNATEANIRKAATRLYEAYIPVRKAFD